MNDKKLLKQINIWFFIIPFLVISVLFSIGMYSSVERKINENYDRFKEDAIDAARNYSYSLKKSVAASRIINELLEEKLIAASKTVMLDSGRFSQAEVKALAASLNVDQISVHNRDGVIMYSNIDRYVGWKAEEGHPVHNFIKSGKKEAMDEIRADTVSGEYYKYAYYRLPSGEFVQIGISAGDVKKFLGRFEISKLLDELNEDPNIDQVSFINRDQIIVESSKHESKGTKIDIPEAALSISEGKEISYVDRSGKEVLYNSFIPLIDKGAVVGALFVSSQQKEAAYFAAEELKNSIWLLVTVFIATGGIMLMIYRNGRNYLRLAYYDTNTGLPNQESLKYFLDNLLRQKKWRGAIFMLNFSHLANMALLYGYEYADKVFKSPDSLQKPYYYVNVLSKHNLDCAPADSESLFIVCPVPDLRFKSDWSDKDAIVDSIIDDFSVRIGKDIRPEIVSRTVYTPEDWQDQYNLHRGSGLGLSHDMNQIGGFRPKNFDEVFKNVFYVGASTVPGTGLPMVIISSKLAFQRVEEYSAKNLD